MKKEITVKYTDAQGNELVLTSNMVKEYISTDPNVSTKEVVMFLMLAKFMKLNPFLKEIYLVKYKGQPAQYVISYHALLARAEMHKEYDGIEVRIEGKIPDMKAIATVWRKDRSHPTVVEVDYAEAVKMVKDSRTGKYRPMGPWATMPKWMLRKVAISRALKEAFPTLIAGGVSIQVSDDTQPVEDVTPIKDDLTTEEANTLLYGEDEKEETKKSEPKPKSKPTPAEPQQYNVIDILLAKTKDSKKAEAIRKEMQEKGELTKERAGEIIKELQGLSKVQS